MIIELLYKPSTNNKATRKSIFDPGLVGDIVAETLYTGLIPFQCKTNHRELWFATPALDLYRPANTREEDDPLWRKRKTLAELEEDLLYAVIDSAVRDKLAQRRIITDISISTIIEERFTASEYPKSGFIGFEGTLDLGRIISKKMVAYYISRLNPHSPRPAVFGFLRKDAKQDNYLMADIIKTRQIQKGLQKRA